MKKVFVINDSGHDMSDAQRYGELVVLTAGEIKKYHLTWLYRKFIERFEGCSQDDYILISGPVVANCVACSIFAVKHKRLNLLLFTGEKYILKNLLFKGEL